MSDAIREFTQKIEHNPDVNALQQVMFTPDGHLLDRKERNQILSEIVTQNQSDLNDYRRRAAIGKLGTGETPVQPLELTNNGNVTLKVAGDTKLLYGDVKNFAKGTEDITIGDKTVSIDTAQPLACRPSVQYPGMQECLPKPRT
jgi:hypothetical protein